jgi:glycosyltransferase involved in cell wall biosynthesis
MDRFHTKPLISFILFTYNHEAYVKNAVTSALMQDYVNLEIIIADDCSTDNTLEIVKECVSSYNGIHRVKVISNETNCGVASQIHRAMSLVNSEYVVFAAGDDVSMPNRVSVLTKAFLKTNSEHVYISSNADIIGEAGSIGTYRPINHNSGSVFDFLSGRNMPLGATEAITKKMYFHFGEMNSNVINEDYVLPFRAYLLGVVVYLPDVLVEYRVGASSLSNFSNQLSRHAQLYRRSIYHRRIAIALSQMLLDLSIFKCQDNAFKSNGYTEKIRHIINKKINQRNLISFNCMVRSKTTIRDKLRSAFTHPFYFAMSFYAILIDKLGWH